MRKLVLAGSIGLVLLAGLGVPSAGAATATPPANPKVVIIVGPVASMTSYYWSDANAAAAEALKYTNNVVKIYTPHATWARVKMALQGASVVINMGHGNGWPSPYAPYQPYTKDGLGLNPKDTTSDNTTTQYWGEYYLARDIRLAPNAVVLLNHLCYSAGNSEPGVPEPTISVAHQRLDNFAAGWLQTGARAVIAEAYHGAVEEVRALFTTHQTIDQLWRNMTDANGNVVSFPSVRTAWATAESDPETRTGPFRRSLVGDLKLQTADITGARYAYTGGDPSTFVVPGAASVNRDAAGLYPDATLTNDPGTGLPPATLALGTAVRVDSRAGTAPDGRPIFAVHTLDGARSGYMSGGDLQPRDSVGPNVWTLDDGTGAFSPNGDGRQDGLTVSGRFSETVNWSARFEQTDGTVLRTVRGSGDTYSASWDGKVGGLPVADGSYQVVVRADDAWGNPSGSKSDTIAVDTVAPSLSAPPAAATTPTFSPNGDGNTDSIKVGFDTTEAGFIDTDVLNGASNTVRSFATSTAAGGSAVTWLGDNDAGAIVPDGTYTVELWPRDLAGNVGAGRSSTVDVYGAVAFVTGSPVLFFPQDADTVSTRTRLSFTLRSAATVTWAVRDAAGQVVYTRLRDAALAAGSYAFNWSGRNQAGAYVPRGVYTSTVEATNGVLASVTRASVRADAFKISSSDATPGRGQSLTFTATTAEPLNASPKLLVYQPGVTTRTVTMTRVSTTSYRVTVRLSSAGNAGTLKIRVNGYDAAGHFQWSAVTFPLH
ncbi:MAG TPA: FlgD immunoglobulin-like domain containing protein [Candidatus Limnocylindrales bacterium]